MENLHSQIKAGRSEISRAKQNKRILLIDDELDSVIARAFVRKQCHIVHCDRVRKAWDCVYPQRPDLIVFRLRQCDRATLADLHECRALAGSVPIIIATSIPLNRNLLKRISRGTTAVIGDCAESLIATEALRCLQSWTISH